MAKQNLIVDGVSKAYDRPIANAVFPPYLSISAGFVEGMTDYVANGYLPSATDDSTIWSGGGSYPGFSAQGAQPLMVQSTVAGDNVGSATGAKTIYIEGLDKDYNTISETVLLNGVSEVLTLQSYLRVNTFSVASGLPALGTITAIQELDSWIMGQIPPEGVSMRGAFFTVPAGSTFFLDKVYASMKRSSATLVTASIQTRKNTIPTWVIASAWTLSEASKVEFDIPSIKILEKTDVRIQILDVSQTNSQIHSIIHGVHVENRMLPGR